MPRVFSNTANKGLPSTIGRESAHSSSLVGFVSQEYKILKNARDLSVMFKKRVVTLTKNKYCSADAKASTLF